MLKMIQELLYSDYYNHDNLVILVNYNNYILLNLHLEMQIKIKTAPTRRN